MASSGSIIAIAGATGTLARLIITHLLRHPEVQVHGLCRRPSRLSDPIRSNPRFTVFQGDATDTGTIRKAVRNASVVICCYLGNDSLMVDGQKTLIDACIAEGVPRYVASDFSMDYRKLAYGDHPPKDPMKIIHAYLQERATDITAVHILNACFLERPWSGLWDSENGSFQYWGTGKEQWEFTTYDNAAEYTAEVALDNEAKGVLSFRGDHIDMEGIAADFEAAYEQKPKLKCLGTLDELYSLMHTTKDLNPQNAGAWLGLFYTYHSLNGQTTLPEAKDCHRYPNVKLVTVRDFFAYTPKGRLEKPSFF